MQSQAISTADYLSGLPEERKIPMEQLRNIIGSNLPEGFSEQMNYGMISFVVPHSIYPKGYHCDPKLPLSFISIASQKNFIALYHMGMYASKELSEWFVNAYSKQVKGKIDMGKSCIRFKKINEIPVELIGELCTRMSVREWIDLYEKNTKR